MNPGRHDDAAALTAIGWRVTLAAALLMALVAGMRSSFGLFFAPLNGASGIGLAALSLAVATGQLALGLVQPAIGALADRHGAARVVAIGALALALTTALPALWAWAPAVAVAIVASAVAGSAVASNGLLIGEVGRAVPAARNGFAVGIVSAGTSVGPLLLGPGTQWGIEQHGWAVALAATGLLALVAWPLATALPARSAAAAAAHRAAGAAAVRVGAVLRDRRFQRIALSFGVCGFHVGFLSAHMPGVIDRCGLPAALAGAWIAIAGAANIAGSIGMGIALRRGDPATLLAGTYLARAAAVGALLVLPATPGVLIGFAVAMGATHMATLPPTAQIVARDHGVARLGTLFGVVMLVHQVGSFAGIALGGWLADATGSDRPLWTIDLALALGAAALAWPSRQRRAPAAHPATQGDTDASPARLAPRGA